MPDYDFLKKLLPIAERETVPAEKGINQAALDTLKSQRDKEADLAAQLASGTDTPLSNSQLRDQLSGIDLSKLPDKTLSIPSLSQEDTTSKLANVDLQDPNSLIAKFQDYQKMANDNKGALAATAAAGAGASMLGSSGGNSQPPVQNQVKPSESSTISAPEVTKPSASINTSGLSKSTSKTIKSDNDEDNSSEETPSKVSDFTPSANLGSVQKLQEFQNKMNQLQGINEGARIGAAAAAGIAGNKNDYDQILSDRSKRISQIPEQYTQAVEFQKQDPNSAISQSYRKMAVYLGLPAHDQTSAAELEKAFPQMVNIKTREDMIAARKEMAQDRTAEQHFRNQMMQLQLQDKASQRQQTADTKQSQIDDKRLDTWARTLAVPSNRSTLGQAANQIYSIDRVQALLNGHPLNDINPQEFTEIAKGLDRVISGGTGTLEGVKSLDPQTARNWVARKLQQITNQSQGAGGASFLKRINYNLENEKTVARKTTQDIANRLLAGADKFAARDPDTMRSFLTRSKLPADLFDQVPSEKILKTADHPLPGTQQPSSQSAAPKSIKPSDVDNMSDAEVEAALKGMGL